MNFCSGRRKKAPAGKHTAIFAVSPAPQRKEKLNVKKEGGDNAETASYYYPNCDASVWLRSCEQEVTQPLHGTITGTVPSWLNGSLLRNGPGSLKVGHNYFDHLFDSSALIHRFDIENGNVTYQCRFVQSEVYKKNWKANRIVSTQFGTKATPDPCRTIFDRVATIFSPKLITSDNSMISVYPFKDEIYAFGETPRIHRINSETLQTEGIVDISENMSIVHHTAHPHVMPDGSVYNLALSIYATGPRHTIVCFPATNDNRSKSMFEEASIVASIPARWPFRPSYMHTFGITENFFIIVEQPLMVSVKAIISAKLSNEPLAKCLRWYENEKILKNKQKRTSHVKNLVYYGIFGRFLQTQINLVSRKTGKLTHKFSAESLFFLHIINQYEVDDHVVLDICIYRDASMLECMYVSAMEKMQDNPKYASMFRSRPARFVLPLNPDKNSITNLVQLIHTTAEAYYLPSGEILVTPEKLINLGCEMPRIHYERYLGKFYRYFYAINADVDADSAGAIIKVDTWNKTVQTWCSDNCYPSEPVFIPSPEPQSEDDGVVLAAVIWGWNDTNRVGLVILDAKTFTEVGRTEFQTSGPVPKCLHGWFVPRSSTLSSSG